MIGDPPIFFQCSVRLLLVVRKLDVQAVTYWGMVALQPTHVALTRPFQGHSLLDITNNRPLLFNVGGYCFWSYLRRVGGGGILAP